MNNYEMAMEILSNGKRKASKSSAWFCAEEAARLAGVVAKKSETNNYPDWEALERDIKSAIGNQIVIVTRHAPLVEWLKIHGVEGKVIAQASADDIRGKDVYGILPMWLASEANSITEVSMPGLPLEARSKVNGGDFTVSQMDDWGAKMQRFIVRKG